MHYVITVRFCYIRIIVVMSILGKLRTTHPKVRNGRCEF